MRASTPYSTVPSAAAARFVHRMSYSRRSTLLMGLVAITCTLFLSNVNVLGVALGFPERFFNPLLLAASTFTLACLGSSLSYVARPPMRWLVFFLLWFLLIASWSALYSPYVNVGMILERNGWQRYAATLLVGLTGCCMMVWAVRSQRFDAFLKLLFFLACACALSPLVFLFFPEASYALQTRTSEARATGLFFADPNEFGLQSLYAFTLGLLLTHRTGQLRWGLVGLVAALHGVWLSFSKTAILAALCLLAAALFMAVRRASARVRRRAILAATVVAVLLILLYVIASAGGGRGIQVFALEQIKRLEHIWAILSSARLDDETTSYRTGVWAHTLRVCAESPILGHGLTAMDNVPGLADRTPHNTFLVILGEGGLTALAGLLPMLLSVAFALARIRSPDVKAFVLSFLFLQFCLWFSLSNSLWIRPQNLMTGIVFGLLTVLSHADYHRGVSPPRAASLHPGLSSPRHLPPPPAAPRRGA